MSTHNTYADVLLPQRIDQPYTYVIPEGMAVGEGAYVVVPVRNSLVTGVVWALHDKPLTAISKIKAISRVYDIPPMPKPLCGLIDWVASYTMASKGNVLKMAMGVPEVFEHMAEREGLRVALQGHKLSDKRQLVVDVVSKAEQPLTVAEAAFAADVSTSTVRAMIKDGILIVVPIPAEGLGWTYRHIALSHEQKIAADQICEAVKAKAYKAFLLDGITGSGKTEVYFEAIAQALASGRQALIMLPEIALSSQSIQRFSDRFGAAPVVWHSDITVAQKRKAWRQILSGEAKVVVGARSALFLPFPDLGVIIVDEEHESAYKQEEGVIYNARDMAVVRAHLGQCPVVLVSATPCLETLDNAEQEKYTWLKLRNRHASATLPKIHIRDMKKTLGEPGKSKSWISDTLKNAIHKAVENGQQALVYLNRRGYAPLIMCGSCGERVSCPNCTAWLVEHKKENYLMCHHCGYIRRKPEACPKCEDKNNLISCGPGVERVAEELHKIFPTYRTEIMASDIMTSVHKLQNLLDDLHSGKINIVVGTQMIAKGHHFPKITVVGVVDADLGLAGGDLRSGERTYQLLNQVAGRAGREELPGNVYLQTFTPHHPVLQALVTGRRDDFIEMESAGRRMNALPPYGRLASLIISSRDKSMVENYVRQLARVVPSIQGVDILGPAPAALAMVRHWHRWRFLLRSPKETRLQPIIRAWLQAAPWPSQVKVQIDVDPYSFL
jgi:primosomal protein N' (replication factor Y)